MTASDLAFVKRTCAYHAWRLKRPDLEDDFVSESCLRVIKSTLPEQAEHRQRFLRQLIGWAVTDYMRTVSVTPRRVIAKIKSGVPLTERERLKVGSVEATDFQQDWVKELAAPTPENTEDVSGMLAKIGPKHPLEFFVLVMHFVHGCGLAHVGELLNVTESRACQLSKGGIALLQREFRKVG